LDPSKALPGSDLIVKGVSRSLAGLLLIYLSSLVEVSSVRIYYLSELLLVVGLSLILHFGILNLATAAWRLLGVDVKELFRSPYKSKSLKEFWGRRWNIAFSEMTALIAYRPLKEKIGPNRALIASFLLSGILHEIAISFPVNSGFGLPLTYFAIHAFLMHIEGASVIVKKVVSHPILSHVWVLSWLVLPMPLLFHSNFVQFVLIPLRNEILNVF
jgi:D-alanyl-lipoteichoic acid acyltransferase DltB (MBOAT superfamily)